MVFQWFYNIQYGLNPLKEYAWYRKEESQNLPSLPDISAEFSPVTSWGSYRYKPDPRFPDNNSDFSKQCFANFAVWRKCLEEFSDDMNPEDPNAQICKKFHTLAFRTCTGFQYKLMTEQLEKDTWMWAVGLNKLPRPGHAPSVLIMQEDNIVTVLNQNENDPRKFERGGSFKSYRYTKA